jgi:hypothetical protein
VRGNPSAKGRVTLENISSAKDNPVANLAGGQPDQSAGQAVTQGVLRITAQFLRVLPQAGSGGGVLHGRRSFRAFQTSWPRDIM